MMKVDQKTTNKKKSKCGRDLGTHTKQFHVLLNKLVIYIHIHREETKKKLNKIISNAYP